MIYRLVSLIRMYHFTIHAHTRAYMCVALTIFFLIFVILSVCLFLLNYTLVRHVRNCIYKKIEIHFAGFIHIFVSLVFVCLPWIGRRWIFARTQRKKPRKCSKYTIKLDSRAPKKRNSNTNKHVKLSVFMFIHVSAYARHPSTQKFIHMCKQNKQQEFISRCVFIAI